MPDGQIGYTRAGSLHLSAEGALVTAEGYLLEPSITIPPNATSVTISREGLVSVSIAGESAPQQVGTLELATFQNPAGLSAAGANLFTVTTASANRRPVSRAWTGSGQLPRASWKSPTSAWSRRW